MTECERNKWNVNWENLDTNNLQSNLLKQHWLTFSNSSGAISQHVGHHFQTSWGAILWQVGCLFISKKCRRKNVKFRVTRHWLELANQWLEVTRQFSWLDYDSTKSWLWLDSDSKGLWLWFDSDPTKMTRTHHCLMLKYFAIANAENI